MTTSKVAATALGFLNALIALLVGLSIVQWSAVQVVLVTAEGNAVAVTVLALWVHFDPGKANEPVAVGAAFTALAAATSALLNGFSIVALTAGQIGLVTSTVTAGTALVTAVFVRRQVTPLVAEPGGINPNPMAAAGRPVPVEPTVTLNGGVTTTSFTGPGYAPPNA